MLIVREGAPRTVFLNTIDSNYWGSLLITSRYLNRLFSNFLGAFPIFYAIHWL